jgi:hypothetical protein
VTALDRLVEAVDELVQPRIHREPYIKRVGATWVHDRHVTHVASLLDQLEQAVEPSGSTLAGHRVPGSAPALRIEAMNVLLVIDTEVSQAVQLWLGEERDSIAANLRALVGLASELGVLDQRDLAKGARRWRTMAAIVTGWEVPAQQLDNTCPLCAARGSLRVRLDTEAASGTGYCTECHETWDETTIGLLANHIKAENGELSTENASRPHRPSVLPVRQPPMWRATCPACEWVWLGTWRAAALRAAEEHREQWQMEVGA